MLEYLVRFMIGGLFVTAFAVFGDVLKPKSFAGLFAAAPSVALASLLLTLHHQGRAFAAREAQAMIGGALAFCAYAYCVSHIIMRYKISAAVAASALLFVWLGVACGIRVICFR